MLLTPTLAFQGNRKPRAATQSLAQPQHSPQTLPTSPKDSVRFGMLHTHQGQQNTSTLIDVRKNMLTQMEQKNVNMDHFSDKVVKWGIRGIGHAVLFGLSWPIHALGGILAPITGGSSLAISAGIHTAAHLLWEGACHLLEKKTGNAVRKAANRLSVLEVPDRLKSAKEKILKNVETLAQDIDKSKTPRAKNLAQGKFLRDSLKAIVESSPDGQNQQTKTKVDMIDQWINILENTQDAKTFKEVDTDTKQQIAILTTEMLKDSHPKIHEAGWEIGRALGLTDSTMRNAKKAS